MIRWVICGIHFLLFSFSGTSQTLIIQIDEGQTFFGDSALSMSQIMDPIHCQSSPKLTKNSRYIVDVSNRQISWFVKNTLVCEWPVNVVNIHGLVCIYILNPYFPGLLMLNLDPLN